MALKKLSEFAKICGLNYEDIESVVRKENIKPRLMPMKYLDETMQDNVARVLFFEGKIKYLTFESKMNVKVSSTVPKDRVKELKDFVKTLQY